MTIDLSEFQSFVQGPSVVGPHVYAVRRELRKITASNNGAPPDLNAIFRRMDADQSGSISRREFARCLIEMGFNITPAEFDAVFDHLDVRGDGSVDAGDFSNFIRGHQLSAVQGAALAGGIAGSFVAPMAGTAGGAALAGGAAQFDQGSKGDTARQVGGVVATGYNAVRELDDQYGIHERVDKIAKDVKVVGLPK